MYALGYQNWINGEITHFYEQMHNDICYSLQHSTGSRGHPTWYLISVNITPVSGSSTFLPVLSLFSANIKSKAGWRICRSTFPTFLYTQSSWSNGALSTQVDMLSFVNSWSVRCNALWLKPWLLTSPTPGRSWLKYKMFIISSNKFRINEDLTSMKLVNGRNIFNIMWPNTIWQHLI